jgi:predicted heme/steroid binding protein
MAAAAPVRRDDGARCPTLHLAAALLAICAALRLLGRGAPPTPLPTPPSPPPKRAPRDRLFTPVELARHASGSADGVYLAILGTVVDVSTGGEFYNPGMEYEHFAGRDASMAFLTGDYASDLTDDLSALASDDEYLTIVGWHAFYEEHANYTIEGRLAGGAFYDADGAATPVRALAFERAARADAAAQLKAGRKRAVGAPRCAEAGDKADVGAARCALLSGLESHQLALDDGTAVCVCVTPDEAAANPALVRSDGSDRPPARLSGADGDDAGIRRTSSDESVSRT